MNEEEKDALAMGSILIPVLIVFFVIIGFIVGWIQFLIGVGVLIALGLFGWGWITLARWVIDRIYKDE